MATERQIRILQLLSRHDSLEVSKLSDLLQVSPSTIRRELTVIEGSGLVVREHGTARLPSPIRYELPFEERAACQIEAKRKIAAAAARLVEPGQVVGLSGGTTATGLARQLRAMEEVTIVTNAVNIALELQAQSIKRVMVTGGIVNQGSYDLVGDLAVQGLQSVHLDLAFQGVSGIDLTFGFTVADEPDAVVARALKAASDRTVIIADHTKIGKATFARFCTLADVDMLITDDGVTTGQCAALEDAGLTVVIAED
jgi:DeoR family transcriptional regulator of aga operon